MREVSHDTRLERGDDHWVGAFRAMAGPCQVLVEADDRREAERVLSVVAAEARRIEDKFSRYRTDNIVHTINRARSAPVAVDDETARMFDFAKRLHGLSDGKFDITSGVLRRAWTFDGSDRIPDEQTVCEALSHVGWQRVRWDGERIALEAGMEIDLGGIGKEYAVDRAASLASEASDASCVVNLGGDLVVSRPRVDGRPWKIGIEDPQSPEPAAARLIDLTAGGLATSGDSRRFLLKDGVRYGHILDPTTGWPVRSVPRSVTVAAGSCTEAGMVATLAMLQGDKAESFLEAQGFKHWVYR